MFLLTYCFFFSWSESFLTFLNSHFVLLLLLLGYLNGPYFWKICLCHHFSLLSMSLSSELIFLYVCMSCCIYVCVNINYLFICRQSKTEKFSHNQRTNKKQLQQKKWTKHVFVSILKIEYQYVSLILDSNSFIHVEFVQFHY